jgi:hypothetical protein
VAASCLAGHAQPPDLAKKTAEPKTSPIAPAAIKLADGTYLWTGLPTDTGGERVILTPQEYQKLLDQNERYKKQIAAFKPSSPSGCAIRGRIEKRGDQVIALLKLTYSVRTTLPQSSISLGGKKGFLVSARLNSNKIPILETTEDGFAVLIEAAGDHTVVLELESPVSVRGAKPEYGFEIGLPRAPITTLVLDPPAPEVKRVNLITRQPDPTPSARPPEPRRLSVEVKQLAAQAGQEAGLPLGAIESLEVTWDPPANTSQPADQIQSAETDIVVQFTESTVETTARIKLRGTARDWKVIAPATAEFSIDRASAAGEPGPTRPPGVTKPADPAKPVWKIELPVGTAATDWIISIVTRQTRPDAKDPRHRGPFAIGPFTVLDVLRQTGTIRVTAAAYTRFVCKHGPDIRPAPPPEMPKDDSSTAYFRMNGGPTGASYVGVPPCTVEAIPLPGSVTVKPSYKLTLYRLNPSEVGWNIRADIQVVPSFTDVSSLDIEIPASWGKVAIPPEVGTVEQGSVQDGFWASLSARYAGGPWIPSVIRFTSVHKQPFSLTLTASLPVVSGRTETAVSLPRFPRLIDGETSVTANVPEDLEVHGEMWGWNGETVAVWATPLSAEAPPSGKPGKTVSTVSGRSEGGLARVTLGWKPPRSDITADIHAEVTVRENQVEVIETIHLRSNEPLARSLKLTGPPDAVGVRAQPTALDPRGKGDWTFHLLPTSGSPEVREVTLKVSYALERKGKGQGQVPVGLFWPASSQRIDTTVSIWTSTATGRTIANTSPGWRELPIEPAAERDTLPILTLAASGGSFPLVLEERLSDDASAVGIWVDRALVQAWVGDEGICRYRTRFHLNHWFTQSLDVRLPAGSSSPDFFWDGLKVDAALLAEPGNEKVYRLPLPDGRSGRTVMIEVRYQLSVVRKELGEVEFVPPRLDNTAYAGPVRWQISFPTGTLPLLIRGASSEYRWQWRNIMFDAGPVKSTEELDQWLRSGSEPGGTDLPGTSLGDILTARQAVPESLSLFRLPRTVFVIFCSTFIFVVLLVIVRLPGSLIGPAIALVSGALGIAAILFPQPAAEAAGACLPGLASLMLFLLGRSAIRWYYRQRVTHLPSFARVSADGSAPATSLPSSGRKRPSSVGSAASAAAGGG